MDESLGVAGEAKVRGDLIELLLVTYPGIACDEQDRSTLKADSRSKTQLTQSRQALKTCAINFSKGGNVDINRAIYFALAGPTLLYQGRLRHGCYFN